MIIKWPLSVLSMIVAFSLAFAVEGTFQKWNALVNDDLIILIVSLSSRLEFD